MKGHIRRGHEFAIEPNSKGPVGHGVGALECAVDGHFVEWLIRVPRHQLDGVFAFVRQRGLIAGQAVWDVEPAPGVISIDSELRIEVIDGLATDRHGKPDHD